MTRYMLVGQLAWPWKPIRAGDPDAARRRHPAVIPTGTVVVATHGKSVVEYRGELFSVNPQFVSDTEATPEGGIPDGFPLEVPTHRG